MPITQVILGFVALILMAAILAAPYALVILFPAQDAALATISATAIPWIVVLLVLMIFNEGIKQVFESIGRAIDRMRRVSAAGATAELGEQGTISITPELAQQISERFQQETNFGWQYYIQFIHATIYRSQYRLLTSLVDDGPKAADEVAEYYADFASKKPKDAEYPITSWLAYLVNNRLVQFNQETSRYEITQHGAAFVTVLRNLGLDGSHFPF